LSPALWLQRTGRIELPEEIPPSTTPVQRSNDGSGESPDECEKSRMNTARCLFDIAGTPFSVPACGNQRTGLRRPESAPGEDRFGARLGGLRLVYRGGVEPSVAHVVDG